MDFSSLIRDKAKKIMGQDDEDHLNASLAHCFVACPGSKDLEDDCRVRKSFVEVRVVPRWAETVVQSVLSTTSVKQDFEIRPIRWVQIIGGLPNIRAATGGILKGDWQAPSGERVH